MIKCIRTILFLLLSANLEASSPRADVLKVTTTGANNSYRFSVTLKSDETGCQQYANWWEILSVDGELLYRRILVHSHPDTQPFTRKGSKVHLNKEQLLFSIKNTVLTNELKPNKFGIGLENIKKRLDLLYKNGHKLEIENKNNLFVVNLTISNLNNLKNV